MKNLTLILFLFMNSMSLYAQEKPKSTLRPYSEFAPDSIAYLEANFERDFSYVDRPIGHLIDDLEIEIKTIEVDFFRQDKRIRSIRFFVQTPEQVEQIRLNGKYVRGLHILSTVKPDNQPLFDAISQGHTSNFIIPWSDEFVKIIRDLKIEDARYY